jgi:hypothetical protein
MKKVIDFVVIGYASFGFAVIGKVIGYASFGFASLGRSLGFAVIGFASLKGSYTANQNF